MNIYLKKFQNLREEKNLDALVICATPFDDRYMRAITGISAILKSLLFIDDQGAWLSIPHFLEEEIRPRLEQEIEVLPAEGERDVIDPIKKQIGKNKKIGVVGEVSFMEINSLSPSSTVNVTDRADHIIMHKTDQFIRQMQSVSKSLSKILHSISVVAGTSQKDIARNIEQKIVGVGGKLSFPICVTSGKDLRHSTCLSPTSKKFQQRDIVCIDCGMQENIQTTDMTRMFTIQNPRAANILKNIELVHHSVLHAFSPETTFDEIVKRYQQESEHIKEIEFNPDDLGHGVGFALHEPPTVERSKAVIGTNIIFTLEPTFVTRFGMMRIEDMIAIDSQGKVHMLTS